MGADEVADSHWRSAGERIQSLIGACAADGAAAQARAEELVREVIELYGAGLTRIIAAIDDRVLADRLAADDLVGSLLLVHGLHPHGVAERVAGPWMPCDLPEFARRRRPAARHRQRRCAACVFGQLPQLPVLGGDPRACGAGCGARRGARNPIRRGGRDAGRAGDPRRRTAIAGAHRPSPTHDLVRRTGAGRPPPGEVAGFVAGDTAVLACRVEDAVLAYLDRCPDCTGSLAGLR